MDKAQIAAIIIGILFIIFFIILFQKGKKTNHHQDLIDEVLRTKIAEQNFEKPE